MKPEKRGDQSVKSSKLAIVLIALIFISFALPGSVLAQGDTPSAPTDDEVNAIAKNMFCPVCENTPLDVCPTQACAEWRELIREKLSEGWNEEQIQQYFVAQFGDRVLAAPPARGINWLIYLIPPLIFIVGAFILYKSIRSMQVNAKQLNQVEAEADQSDEYINRIEKELQKQ